MFRFEKYHYMILFLVFINLLLSSCNKLEGNATDGKRWYRMHNCYACHGENGYDGDGPDISGLDWSNRKFISRLRNAETPIMPEYSKNKISDQDAVDILAFLQRVR